MMGRALEPELLAMFNDWNQQYKGIKTKIYTTMNPKEKQCVLAIYGDHTHITKLTDFYTAMFRELSANFSANSIWLKAGIKPWRPDKPFQHEDDRIVGVVFGVVNDGIQMYLEGEGGLHILEEQNEPYKYIVETRSGLLSTFEPPEDIHRQKFFESRKTRRTYYSGKLIEDTTYELQCPPEQLYKHLNERFFRIITERLIGE